MESAYAPERGDLVWIYEAHAEHEQDSRRPALVLSASAYNQTAGLALFCAVACRAKGYPFEIQIPDGLKVDGVVLCDQVRSLDWRARKVEFADRAPTLVVREALRKFSTLIQTG